MKNLYLFDIDGTLVNLTQDPKRDPYLKAYQRAYRETLGIEVPPSIIIDTYGKTEIEMHRLICGQPEIAEQLRNKGISFSDELSRRITEAWSPRLMEELRYLQAIKPIVPLEGVVEFLTYLNSHNEYTGVVTGLLREAAEFILNEAGLIGFFYILSCDDGKSKRTQVVQRAIDEAKGRGYDFQKIIVIGDTTNDIEAGKYVNAFTVGVATGSVSLDDLRKENPDLVLPDLTQYRRILEAIK